MRDLNPEMLNSFRELGPDFVADVVGVFLSSARKQLVELEAAVERGEMSVVYKSAHKLKGSAIQVGAEALGDACARMEAGAKHGGTGSEAALLVEIKAAWDRLVPLLS